MIQSDCTTRGILKSERLNYLLTALGPVLFVKIVTGRCKSFSRAPSSKLSIPSSKDPCFKHLSTLATSYNCDVHGNF